MEWLEGKKLSIARDAPDLLKRRLLDNGVTSSVNQLLQFGFIHGDPVILRFLSPPSSLVEMHTRLRSLGFSFFDYF